MDWLEEALRIPESELRAIAEAKQQFVEELDIWDPRKPDKPRHVIQMTGPFREIQELIYDKLLLRKLSPSIYSHGSVPGRSILTNAHPHRGNQFIYTADIRRFFPSISHKRVNTLFMNELQCSPAVSHLLTQFCTYKFHLALGLVTSPIIADQVMSKVDHRLGHACEKLGLVYTRFVDDIAISGSYDLRRCKIGRLVTEILGQNGFRMQRSKEESGTSESVAITKLVLKDDHIDVPSVFLKEATRQIEDHLSLGKRGRFVGPYLTSQQLIGRVKYIVWVNPAHRKSLFKALNRIDWQAVRSEALRRRLVAAKKCVLPRGSPKPSFEACYGVPTRAGREVNPKSEVLMAD